MSRKKDSKEKTTQASGTPSSARFITGIVLIVLGILFFIAIGAFFVTGGADRSIFDMPFSELISNSDIEIRNPLGKFGAWFADMVVTNGIGAMSLAIPYLLFMTGIYVLGIKGFSLRKQYAYTICVTIWGSILLGFAFYAFSDRTYTLAGGAHGHYIAQWLMNAIGIVGTFAVLMLCLVAFMAVKSDSLKKNSVEFLRKLHLPSWVHLPSPIDHGYPEEGDLETETEGETTEQPEEGEDDEEDNVSFVNEHDEEEETDTTPTSPILPIETEEQNEPTDEVGDGDIEIVVHPQEPEPPEPPKEIKVINTGEEAQGMDHITADVPYDPTLTLSDFEQPPLTLLKDYPNQDNVNQAELIENNNKIVEVLGTFGIGIDNIEAIVGPTVTLYKIKPAPGVKIAKINGLQDNIAMSLAAQGIRIIAPIPNETAVGIEVPNTKPKIVGMRSVLKSRAFQNSKAELPVAIGKTISNETYVFDLAKTPHILVAGATGQGKSVGLNAIITSLLYKMHPSQVKFVMVDPKMVEFSVYKVLEKHYLAKMENSDNAIITDIEKVKDTLDSLTIEMDNRYKLLEQAEVRKITEYNEKFIARRLNPEKGHRFLPYIVVIIDEFADLIMQAGKEVEMPIARIAQKARAVGIHLILATQRPSTNVITGIIKANFPSRIAFRVSQMVDSRTILDRTGAQHLIGRGDMLILENGKMDPVRVQCAFVDTDEVMNINEFISSQRGYATAYELPECQSSSGDAEGDSGFDGGDPSKLDNKIKEVAQMVVSSQIGSTSNIQRQFSLGYNRAGKIMDQLERLGIVSPANGSKPREVLVTTQGELSAILARFGIE